MTDTTTPTRPDVLRALADRVERGESGREIEYEIARAVFPNIGEARIFVVGDDEPIFFSEPYRKQPAPHYTTSLDATEALRQAVLPGWRLRISQQEDRVVVDAVPPDLERFGAVVCHATTEPAARLAALLRALAAQEKEIGR